MKNKKEISLKDYIQKKYKLANGKYIIFIEPITKNDDEENETNNGNENKSKKIKCIQKMIHITEKMNRNLEQFKEDCIIDNLKNDESDSGIPYKDLLLKFIEDGYYNGNLQD